MRWDIRHCALFIPIVSANTASQFGIVVALGLTALLTGGLRNFTSSNQP